MFPEMRRAGQKLPQAAICRLLSQCTSGVLALTGPDGWPYAVPMSFCFAGDRIWFHGSDQGHRGRALARCSKASFCVIAQDEVDPGRLTTRYQSVIVYGTLRPLTDPQQRRDAAMALAARYGRAAADAAQAEIDAYPQMVLWEMEIAHMTGKQSLDLAQAQQNV